MSDSNKVWYPCAPIQQQHEFPPIRISKAKGSYFTLDNGHKIIDATASWWCKSLGHQHPLIKRAVKEQMDRFEHVLMANTENETLVTLSQRLSDCWENDYHSFYAGDGACATEIALKMSFHARKLRGENRFRLVSLTNGYHGETLAALSVGDLEKYSEPYRDFLLPCEYIEPPYVNSMDDPLWSDSALYWERTRQQLEPFVDEITAVIVEPIIQGAGGMKLYSADYLKRLSKYCRDNNIHLIADEIMTGFYRTGKRFACEHAEIEPDFVCLGKGLTAGFIPMSAVLVRQEIFEIFEHETEGSFWHSHTYSGNALGSAAAMAMLDVVEQAEFQTHLAALSKSMHQLMSEIPGVKNVRGIGAIAAADLAAGNGFEFFQKSVQNGAWLRPLGNTIYWFPPLNMPLKVLKELAEATELATNFPHFLT